MKTSELVEVMLKQFYGGTNMVVIYVFSTLLYYEIVGMAFNCRDLLRRRSVGPQKFTLRLQPQFLPEEAEIC